MKRVLNQFSLLVCVVTMLFACADEPIPQPDSEERILPIQEIPMGTELLYNDYTTRTPLRIPSQFRTLEFEKGYVFSSAEEYLSAMSADTKFVDSLVAETVDFSSNSVLAVTGLASSFVESISHRLVEEDGDLRLDIHIQVADSARAAQKWNLLLKVPAMPSQIIPCNITTNQPLVNQLPTYAYPYTGCDPLYEGWFKVLRLNDINSEVGVFGGHFSKVFGAYQIHFDKENGNKIIDAINQNSTCLIARRNYNSSYIMTGPQTPLDTLTCGANDRGLLVYNCDFEQTFASVRSLIKTIKEVYTVRTSGGIGPAYAVFDDCFELKLGYYDSKLLAPLFQATQISTATDKNGILSIGVRNSAINTLDLITVLNWSYAAVTHKQLLGLTYYDDSYIMLPTQEKVYYEYPNWR